LQILGLNTVRCFGAAGGPREQVHSSHSNTSINVPNQADIDHHVPKNYITNDKFLSWVHGRAPVDRLSDKLINDNPNKYAAYYHFGKNPLLQNSLILKAVRLMFGESNATTQTVDSHASFNGVKTHENGVFLY